MDTLEEDKHIAAASLLSLTTSTKIAHPTPSQANDTAAGKVLHVDSGPAESLNKTEDGSLSTVKASSPSPLLSPQAVSCYSDDGNSQKCKDDSSEEQVLSRSSSAASVKGIDEVPCSHRRHSCPVTLNMENPESATKNMSKAKNIPHLLMELLTNKAYQDTLCFLPDKNKFLIVNNKRFSEEIMPNHFNVPKFGFFLNMLGQWGFKHAVLKSNQHLFCHPYFVMNEWALLRCLSIKAMITDSKNSNTSSKKQVSTKKRKDVEMSNNPNQTKSQKTSHYKPDQTTMYPPSSFDEVLRRQYEAELFHDYMIHHQSFSPSQSAVFPLESHVSSAVTCDNIEMNQVTKDVVARAIECLLNDKDHTQDLFLRRGQQIGIDTRRLSLPYLRAPPSDMHFVS